jgi:hypothetical protein
MTKTIICLVLIALICLSNEQDPMRSSEIEVGKSEIASTRTNNLPSYVYLLNAAKKILLGSSNNTQIEDVGNFFFDFVEKNQEMTLNELLGLTTQQFLLFLKNYYDESSYNGKNPTILSELFYQPLICLNNFEDLKNQWFDILQILAKDGSTKITLKELKPFIGVVLFEYDF